MPKAWRLCQSLENHAKATMMTTTIVSPLLSQRVVRNRVVVGIFICYSFASAIIAGTVIFVAKYMENQFGITASLALFLRGSIEVPLVCLSFFIGGTFMSR